MKHRLIAVFGAAVLAASALFSGTASADSRKVVTLGADLDEQQKNAILRYFGAANDPSIQILTITNQDERNHLGSYVPLEQIGTRTYSCAMVKPTNSGGIQVKTANLSWVTSNMIATTLSTSGVRNCEVLAAAPFEVSGTGALTGILMAYETAAGETLDTGKKEVATQELVTTTELADSIGQTDATKLINETKIQIISGNVVDQDDITVVVDNTIDKEGLELSEQDRELLYDLLSEISRQDYEYDDMKDTLQRVEANMEQILDGSSSYGLEVDEAGQAEENDYNTDAQNQEIVQGLEMDGYEEDLTDEIGTVEDGMGLEMDEDSEDDDWDLEEEEDEEWDEELDADSILMNTDDSALGLDVLIDATTQQALQNSEEILGGQEEEPEQEDDLMFDIVSEDSSSLEEEPAEDVESINMDIPAVDVPEEEPAAEDYPEEIPMPEDDEILSLDESFEEDVESMPEEEGLVIDEAGLEEDYPEEEVFDGAEMDGEASSAVIEASELAFAPGLDTLTAAGTDTLILYIPHAQMIPGQGTLTVYQENDMAVFDSVSWQGTGGSTATMPMNGEELSTYGWSEGTKAVILLNQPLAASRGYHVELSAEAFVSEDGSLYTEGIEDTTLWSFETGENGVSISHSGMVSAGDFLTLSVQMAGGCESASVTSFDSGKIDFGSTWFDLQNQSADLILLGSGTVSFDVEFYDAAGELYETVTCLMNIQ